jgi:lipopolysaccharide exporter
MSVDSGNLTEKTQHASKPLARVARTGLVWGFARPGISQIIEIPATLILARSLEPEEFGIAAAVSFFLRLSNKIGSLGLGGALIRLKELRPEHLSSVFVVNLIVGIGLWGSLTAAASTLANFFGNQSVAPALRVAALVYLALPFGVVQIAIIARDMRFRQAAIIEWVYPIVFLFVAVPLAWLHAGFWSLIYGQLFANVLQTVAKIYFGRWRPTLSFSKVALRETIPFGMGLQAKNMLNFAAEYIDSLLVGRLFGMIALGFYDKAFNTMDRLAGRLTVSLVSMRIFALIRDDPDRLRRAYERVLFSVSLAAFPVFAGLIVTAPQLITVLYGEKWQPSVLAFQILCATAPFRMLNAYASSVTQATGRIWPEVWRQLTYVIMIVVGVWTFRTWGIVGTAFGVSAATVCMGLMMQIFACATIGFRWRRVLRAQAPGLSLAVAVACVTFGMNAFMRHQLGASAAWELLIAQVAAGLVVFILFVAFAPVPAVGELIEDLLGDIAPGMVRLLRSFNRHHSAAVASPLQHGPSRASSATAKADAVCSERSLS